MGLGFDVYQGKVIGLQGTPSIGVSVIVLIVLQLIFTHVPAMQLWFGSAHLDAGAWLRCVLVGIALLLIVEADKLLLRSFRPAI